MLKNVYVNDNFQLRNFLFGSKNQSDFWDLDWVFVFIFGDLGDEVEREGEFQVQFVF